MNLRIFDKPGGCWLMFMGAILLIGLVAMTPWQVMPLAVLKYAWPLLLVALLLIGTGAYFFLRRQPGNNVPH